MKTIGYIRRIFVLKTRKQRKVNTAAVPIPVFLNKENAIIIIAYFMNSSLSATSYGEIYGAHSRAVGMGNAVTAVVNDSSAVFYNPAGLGRNNFVQNYIELQKSKGPAVIMPFITTQESLKKKTPGKKTEDEKKTSPYLKSQGGVNVLMCLSKKGI